MVSRLRTPEVRRLIRIVLRPSSFPPQQRHAVPRRTPHRPHGVLPHRLSRERIGVVKQHFGFPNVVDGPWFPLRYAFAILSVNAC